MSSFPASVWPSEGNSVRKSVSEAISTPVEGLDLEIKVPYHYPCVPQPPTRYVERLTTECLFPSEPIIVSGRNFLLLPFHEDSTKYPNSSPPPDTDTFNLSPNEDSPSETEPTKSTLYSIVSNALSFWRPSTPSQPALLESPPTTCNEEVSDVAFSADFCWEVGRYYLTKQRHHDENSASVNLSPTHMSFTAIFNAFVDDILAKSLHARHETNDPVVKTRVFAELSALRALVLHGIELERLLEHHDGQKWTLTIFNSTIDISSAITRVEELPTRCERRVLTSRDSIAYELLSHVVNRLKKTKLLSCWFLTIGTHVGEYPELSIRKKIIAAARHSTSDSALALIDAFALLVGLKGIDDHDELVRALIANQMMFRLASSSFYYSLGIDWVLDIPMEKALRLSSPLKPSSTDGKCITEKLEELLQQRINDDNAILVESVRNDEKPRWASVHLCNDFDSIIDFVAMDGLWLPESTGRYVGDTNNVLLNISEDVWAVVNPNGEYDGFIGEVSYSLVSAVLLLIVLAKFAVANIAESNEVQYRCEDGRTVFCSDKNEFLLQTTEEGEIHPIVDATAWRIKDDIAVYLLSVAMKMRRNSEKDALTVNEAATDLIHTLCVGEEILGNVAKLNEATVSLRLLSRLAVSTEERFSCFDNALVSLAIEYSDVAGEISTHSISIKPQGGSVNDVPDSDGKEAAKSVSGILLKPVQDRAGKLPEFSTELEFDFNGRKYRATTDDGTLTLKPHVKGRRMSAKFKKKKIGVTLLGNGVVYEDGNEKKVWKGQEAYTKISEFANGSGVVRDWLWTAILGGCVDWKSTGSCTGMWPICAQSDDAKISPNRPMPMAVLAKLDVISNGKQVLVLPFEGSHFFKLTKGSAGLYRAEEIIEETELNLNGFKKYVIDAVTNVS